MTKELSIAARDRGAGIAQERLDGVAYGRRLPVVAIEMIDVKNDLGDFLLCRAGAIAVEGAQHPALADALLTCQARVGRNSAAMQRREKSIDGLDSVEAVYAERNDRNGTFFSVNGVVDDLDALTVREGKAKCRVFITHRHVSPPQFGTIARDAGAEVNWCLGEHNNACVLLRKPEDRRFRRRCQGVDREIATPTAVEFARSVVREFREPRPTPENPRHKRRYGGAIPKPDRTLSARPDGHIPRNARSMRRVSSLILPSFCLSIWGIHDSRFG